MKQMREDDKALLFEVELLNQRFFEMHRDALEIARLKNLAENGRIINILMFALLTVLAAVVDPAYFAGALLPVLSLSLVWIGDRLRSDIFLWPSIITTIISMTFIPVIGF